MILMSYMSDELKTREKFSKKILLELRHESFEKTGRIWFSNAAITALPVPEKKSAKNNSPVS